MSPKHLEQAMAEWAETEPIALFALPPNMLNSRIVVPVKAADLEEEEGVGTQFAEERMGWNVYSSS